MQEPLICECSDEIEHPGTNILLEVARDSMVNHCNLIISYTRHLTLCVFSQ